jgi:endonuclease/exonuclease/phosphatase family metal-dependent hydrolase
MVSISLVSINIERSRHLDRVASFLLAQSPDVVCMQELCEKDIADFESLLSMRCVYAPSGRHPADPPETGGVVVGCAIFSHLPLLEHSIEYYAGSRDDAISPDIDTYFYNSALVVCDFEKAGTPFRIATTHFTWTPNGAANDAQRENVAALLGLLDSSEEFVLTGDFNAPRMYEGKPGEIFTQIASRYRDNIPPHYLTSIDIDLHRSGKIRPHELVDKMVDGVFSTPAYHVSDVELHTGISDHCAVSATVTRSLDPMEV